MAKPAKPKPTSKDVATTPKGSGGRGRAGKLGWVVGWVLVPGLVIGTLFLSGVHIGARHPDMFLTRGVLWMTGSEAQRGPQDSAQAAPLGRELYLMAMPKKEFGLQVELSVEEVAALTPDIDPAVLDCETLCARVWADQHPDKVLVETTACEASDKAKGGPVGTLECQLIVER